MSINDYCRMIAAVIVVTVCYSGETPRPFDLVEVLPLNETIIMIHVKEGHVVHQKLGERRKDGERVELTQLDVVAAVNPEKWNVSCKSDNKFAKNVKPIKIGRKSKGTEFAFMMQGWDQKEGRAVNKDPDHAKEHWLYLVLPQAMKSGCIYRVDGTGVPGIGVRECKYEPRASRSEAIHVNLIGYVSDVTAKYAYIYHWGGDIGSVDFGFANGKKFQIIDQKNGAIAYEGVVSFRSPFNQVETGQMQDTPNGNFLNADVWECDFGGFTRPGTYVVSVDGIGCSFPFEIGADVYRKAFVTTCRGLYHNRSGIALVKPFTQFVRPAPHNVLLTPGFKGKLLYTTSRWMDWKNQDADAVDRPAIEEGIKGPLEVSGWYQDAGDWDSYPSHTNVASTLCFSYETAPMNFSDGELNIPEGGNGVPDILDEAAWLPRFCYRLRHELISKGWGTGGLGLRICGDHFGGDLRADGTTKASWQDIDRKWIVSGEDPVSTFRYAGVAAHLAHCLALAGVKDPENVDWETEASESYAWAIRRSLPKDEDVVRSQRVYAAAGLFRLTGDPDYERQVDADTNGFKPNEDLQRDRAYGPWVYLLGGGKGVARPDLIQRLKTCVMNSCERVAITTSERRGLRWGGYWHMPMLVGQQTTPTILEGMIGHALTKTDNPEKAKAFRSAVATTCDYVLGTNALNQTWVTGLGVRHVREVFHMDAWYNGLGQVHPGIVPYGPWRTDGGVGKGPWDNSWSNSTVYPTIKNWPGNECYFENRNCPLSAEFTIHQTTCYAASVFGWMCSPKQK